MLAKPTKAIGEVLDRFEGKEFTCEYKYDGERAQVSRGSFFFSNSRSSTSQYHRYTASRAESSSSSAAIQRI